MIEYLVESTLCLAIFYTMYEVFLKGSLNYMANRIFLLLAPLFSVFVPLLNISMDASAVREIGKGSRVLEVLPVSGYIPTGGLPSISNIGDGIFNISSLLLIAYTTVALILLLRFVLHLNTLFFKWHRAEKVNYKGHTLSLIEEKIPPFTFFQAIFMNSEEFGSDKFKKELIVHEIAHKYQWHSIDIVLMELLQAIFWFNPFIYWFKRKIKTNHEYLADDFVLRCGMDFKEYADQLLEYTFPHKITGFASAFNNHLTIKNRLIMLSRFQEKRPKAFRFLLLLPITALLFFSTAFNEIALLDNISSARTQEDKLLENPGVIYADNLTWSSADLRIYLKGDYIRIVHGANNFTGNGGATYLGVVYHFVLDNEMVPKDVPIDISGLKCTVVKLGPKEAEKKYGSVAKMGAVEIITGNP